MRAFLDRRNFLQLVPAALAAACGSSSADTPRGRTASDAGAPTPDAGPALAGSGSAPQRVLVLGAGLAGLAAAYELDKRGHDVHVIEAQARPGGRVLTLRGTLGEGSVVEAGAIAVAADDEHVLRYVKELGLQLGEHAAGEKLFYVDGKRFVPSGRSSTEPWPLDGMNAAEQAKGLALEDDYVRRHVAEIGDPAQPGWPKAAALAFDGMTAVDFVRAMGASAAWAHLYRAEQGAELTRLAALAWLLRLPASAGSTRSRFIEGGNDKLPRALASKLEGKILYESIAVKITQDDLHVVVTFRGKDGMLTSLEAEHLVCAIPFATLRDVEVAPTFSRDKERAVFELEMMPVVRVYHRTKSAFWRSDPLGALGGLTMCATDTTAERVGDASALEASSGRGLLTSLLEDANAVAFAALPEPDRASTNRLAIATFLPRLGETGAVEASGSTIWQADPWARGGWAAPAKDQTSWIFAAAKRPEGRIHFAGEHTSVQGGTMNGALESGLRCASEIDAA